MGRDARARFTGLTNERWLRYFVADNTHWCVPRYPADNAKRPTGPPCDGCHSVNYDVTTKQVTEWNVGCETCHGPGGSTPPGRPARTSSHPARADPVHASDRCIQCHSQGQPLKNPTGSRYYDWPVASAPAST